MNSLRYFSTKIVIISAGLLAFAPAALAQNAVSTKALEKTRFYNAPRQIDILDDRPVVRDFREGPESAGQIALPNGPGGGAAGGPGAGGVGDFGGGSGANTTIPGGGLHLPGGSSEPGYRNAPAGMRSLPQSGFSGSNIPARGLGPRGILPSGVSTGVIGKIVNQNKRISQAQAANPARAMSVRGPSGGGKPSGGPSVANYGGYGNSPVSYGNSNRTDLKVRGYLLNH